MKTKLFLIAIALFFVSASLRAAVTPFNFWNNPTFEVDPATPAGGSWGLGGSDSSINQWSTAKSVSLTHSLAEIDASGGNGEWYRDQAIGGFLTTGQTISLHWYEIYNISTNAGHEMRVTVRFLDAAFNGVDNHFVVSGNSAGWTGTLAGSTFTERNQSLVVDTGLFTTPVWLRIQLASGGPGATTGSYLIDDLSVGVVPEPSTIALLSVGGLVGLSVIARRRKIAR